MSLPLGVVRQKDIATCKILKKNPSTTYVNLSSQTRLSPPTYVETTMNEFAVPYPEVTPTPILWDYHYDLMNDFEWARWLPIGLNPHYFLNKRHPRKFKYRLFRVYTIFGSSPVVTTDGWKEVEFAAVIMPNFRSPTDTNVVAEDNPAPPSLFEDSGAPDNEVGRTGDFYFDLSTTMEGTARLYGPKVAVPGDGNTILEPSIGIWVVTPLPPLANIDTTRALTQFHKYKSKKAQIHTGLPVIEDTDRFGGGAQSAQVVYGDGATSYIPRWPTIPFDARPFVTEFPRVRYLAYSKLPLFKPPEIGNQQVFPMWNTACDEPVWGLDSGLGHHNSTTVRVGDYSGAMEVGVGNLPWPLTGRTESAIPTFGMWSEQQLQIDAFLNSATPFFNHALVYLPEAFVPIGGRVPTADHAEQINPVPIDPFFFDPDHPDGEYGTFTYPSSLQGGNFKGSNLHYATNGNEIFNPSFPDNPDGEIYYLQSTMILE